MELGIINAPQLWLLDPRYMLTIVIIVSLWMSMGTGFLSFVAGFQGIDRSMYEAGYVDGVRNRWQELYHITLPSMKPMLLFGAVMSIASSFNISDVPRALCGFPPRTTRPVPWSPTCLTTALSGLRWATPAPSR